MKVLFATIAVFLGVCSAKVCSPLVINDCQPGDDRTMSAYPRDEMMEALEFARKTYKADFNIFQIWAEKSPLAARAWIQLEQTLMTSKVLSGSEIQIIALVTSNLNRCTYCMHFHAAVAQMFGVTIQDARETRDGGLPADRRLRIIAEATKLVYSKKGQLNGEDRDWLLYVGISDAQLYEITAHVGLINYANMLNLIQMPVTDEVLRSGVDEFRLHRPMSTAHLSSMHTPPPPPAGRSGQHPPKREL